MENFISKLKLKFGRDLWYRAYADDLVFITRHTNLPRLITLIKEICPEYNLKLNPKKSNWMRLKRHKNIKNYDLEETHNIKEETHTFRYLGIHIDACGRIPLKN